MARKTMIEKQKKESKYRIRTYARCRLYGGPHSVLRKSGTCRTCSRELTYEGEILGYRKASW